MKNAIKPETNDMLKFKFMQSFVFAFLCGAIWILKKETCEEIEPFGSYRDGPYTPSFEWCKEIDKLERLLLNMNEARNEMDVILAVEFGIHLRVGIFEKEIINPKILDAGNEVTECMIFVNNSWIKKNRSNRITLLYFDKMLHKTTEIFKDEKACTVQAMMDSMNGILA